MTTGWLCPKCNSAHGPHVDTCPAANCWPVRVGDTWPPYDGRPIPIGVPYTAPLLPWPLATTGGTVGIKADLQTICYN